MRWICLRNASRNVKLIIRRILVNEIVIINFHSYAMIESPLLPKSILKRLHNKNFERIAMYL